MIIANKWVQLLLLRCCKFWALSRKNKQTNKQTKTGHWHNSHNLCVRHTHRRKIKALEAEAFRKGRWKQEGRPRDRVVRYRPPHQRAP